MPGVIPLRSQSVGPALALTGAPVASSDLFTRLRHRIRGNLRVSDRRPPRPAAADPDSSLLLTLAAWLPRRLRGWFARRRRDLPWRRDRDPYRIWVSEVMLQQTQVATVVPYFERFMAAFPTLAALATADEQDVLRLWEGLGYYRRARDMHRAARLLVAEHGGRLVDDPAVLARLPGFGQYTCNAVLSQAFDRRLPIVEANSQRVLSRLFGWTDDPRQGPARRRLWQAAARLLPPKDVGEFNQALMELGALICTPATPRCTKCPLAARCVARKLGLQETIPTRTPAPQIVQVQEVGIVLRRGRKLLLAQRPAHGRWAGMWEVPRSPVHSGEDHAAAARRLLHELNLTAELGAEVLTIRHAVTRFRITLLCLEAHYVAGRFRSESYANAAWVVPAQLSAYPLSRPQRRLAEALNEAQRQARLF
jgi:A/G-specific adenine glycosylase